MDPCLNSPSVSLHGLEQSIVALPYQLGYRPRDSLVLICLGSVPGRGRGGRPWTGERVTLTARVDLPAAAEQEACVAALDPALRRRETRAVIAVVFADAPPVGLSVSALVAAVSARARGWGVAVGARAVVSGRSWRLVPPGEKAGPWRSLPAARDVPAVADYVADGRAPARDRRAVADLLRPADVALAEQVGSLLRDATAYGSPGEVGVVTPAQAALVARVFEQVASSGDTPASSLRASEIARCVSALHDVSLRDLILSRSTGIEWGSNDASASLRDAVHAHLGRGTCVGRMTVARLASVAAYAPRRWAAPCQTVTGLLAWNAGDGALANIAIQAALHSDPGYRLARLMDLTVSNAVPPPALRRNHGAAGCV